VARPDYNPGASLTEGMSQEVQVYNNEIGHMAAIVLAARLTELNKSGSGSLSCL
jgi:hypothetical protein